MSEHLAYALYAFNKNVYLLLCVIHGKRGSHRALYAETYHEGLGAVVTGANGYAETVEQRAHVEMVDVAYEERNHGVFIIGRAEESDTVYLLHPLHAISCEFLLMTRDVVDAYRTDIVDGGEWQHSRACLPQT